MSDCLFCRIVNRAIPAQVVYEDERVLAFRDIAPQAPVHILVIPKRHIDSLAAAGEEDTELLGALLQCVRTVMRDKGVTDGYRVVTNVGRDGGQSVGHLHLHALAGRQLSWPPG